MIFFIRDAYLCFITEFQEFPPFYKFSFSSYPGVMGASYTFDLIGELEAIINIQVKTFFYLNIKSQLLFFFLTINNIFYQSGIKMCLTI